jgi:hypothetical protein
LLVAGAVGAFLVLAMGGVALSRGWLGLRAPAPPTQAPTLISVPAGTSARVERRGRYRMSLQGPSALELGPDDQAVRLQEGRVEVENQASAVAVEAAGRRVEIPPVSTAIVELRAAGTLRVDPVAGAAPRIDGAPAARAPAPAPAVAPPPIPAPDRDPPASVEPPRPPVVARQVAPAEVTLVRDALESLRKKHEPAAALRLLESHERRFPDGLLRDEAAVIRIEALLALGRSAEALTRLEAIRPALVDGSPRLLVARGELRARAGRCQEALADFAVVLSMPVDDDLDGRASRGRASCLEASGL